MGEVEACGFGALPLAQRWLKVFQSILQLESSISEVGYF